MAMETTRASGRIRRGLGRRLLRFSPQSMRQRRRIIIFTSTALRLRRIQVLAELEKVTGDKFEIKRDTTAELRKRSLEQVANGNAAAIMGLISAGAYGEEGLNEYSKNVEGGLWNERLGLTEESFEETVRKVVKA